MPHRHGERPIQFSGARGRRALERAAAIGPRFRRPTVNFTSPFGPQLTEGGVIFPPVGTCRAPGDARA